MNRRRLLVAIAVLLGVLVVANALAPDPDRAEKPFVPAGASGASDVVTGELPRDRVVPADVGDVVELTVTTARPEAVEVPVLGKTEVATAEAPARFSLYADRPGRFPVVLSSTRRPIGAVVVRR